MHKYPLFIPILFLLLGACVAAPTTLVSEQQIFPISVAFSPHLKPMTEALQTCAVTIEDTSLLLFETPLSSETLNFYDIHLILGEKELSQFDDQNPYIVALAEDSLVFITALDVPKQSLTQEKIRSVIMGEITRWDELDSALDSSPITFWTFPSGDSLREILIADFLHSGRITSNARIAPDPAKMLGAIRKQYSAIGYVSKAWLNENPDFKFREIVFDGIGIPVLAITKSEPTGVLRKFLSCLQSGAGQEALLALYNPLPVSK